MRLKPGIRKGSPVIARPAELFRLSAISPAHMEMLRKKPDAAYESFPVPKSDGTERIICAPTLWLRRGQRAFLDWAYGRILLPSFLHGGIPRSSPITNAKPHVGKHMVATLDIKDFFPSTTLKHVRAALELLGLRGGALDAALLLTTKAGCLPQGAPTSPLLANLALGSVDHQIMNLCTARSLIYTRYLDDIAISGASSFSELRGPLLNAIERGGYVVAKQKVHFRDRSVRQVVTGLVVNDRLRPTREFIDKLRDTIHACMDGGAAWVARANGLRVGELKRKINGCISHVAQCDDKIASKLRGRMCAVDWRELP